MNKMARDNKQGVLLSVFKGLGLSYIITCAVFVACALILTYTDVSMNCIPVVAVICTAISCVAGGFKTASSLDSRGLMWGVVTGGMYAAILIAINIMAGSESAGIMGKVTMAVCALASGGIGGIVGVNRK